MRTGHWSRLKAARIRAETRSAIEIINIGGPGWPGHRSMGTEDQSGYILPAVFVMDPFGEVFDAISEHAEQKVAVEEISGWINFINFQCPECGPLKWPY